MELSMKNVIKYSLVAAAIAVSFNANALTEDGGDDLFPRTVREETIRARTAERAIAEQAQKLSAESREFTGQVGAMSLSAAAAAANSNPTEGKRTVISGAVGSFKGYSAVSLGAAHLISRDVKVFGSVSGANGGDIGGAIGASFSF